MVWCVMVRVSGWRERAVFDKACLVDEQQDPDNNTNLGKHTSLTPNYNYKVR